VDAVHNPKKNYGNLMVKGCIAGGISGSPILSDKGRVVEVASITSS